MTTPAPPRDLFSPPPPEAGPDAIDTWAFERARRLLDETALVCDGRSHRLREIELYLHSPGHPDPFVHRAAEQARAGAWYFHRVGGSYRGGTFKGLDLSTGGPGVGCGWLLRCIETADRRLIDGSCNVVDHLLAIAGEAAIAPLDAASPDAGDARGRLHLAARIRPDAETSDDTLLATPRVGLTLKRAAQHGQMPRYIGRRLRFITRPRRIKKGRAQTIAALLADGCDVDAIRARTGSPAASIRRAAAAFADGRGRPPDAWIGRRLSSVALYGLYGACMTPPEVR